ncbi:uncharacterized protein LOC141658832 [Silene latifolia]|uniref:uncharacterized protein LOC141658832 n=1 Tax=Silene latifolia TaxID=37657 RepID=UPI003D7710B8
MGSISALETALEMTKANQGKLPAAPDLFFRIHSVVVDAATGKRELKSNKDKEVYGKYNEKLNEAGENEDGQLENADTENENGDNQVSENVKKDAVFLKAVGGRKKGQVNGLGCADELFYKKTTRNKRTSSMAATSYCPGVVRQLEERVQQSEKAREQLEKANEEIKNAREDDRLLFDQRLEAQKEEMMKKMKEHFQLMQQQFSCHNNITPRRNLDEDPFGGNGGATMQVS